MFSRWRSTFRNRRNQRWAMARRHRRSRSIRWRLRNIFRTHRFRRWQNFLSLNSLGKFCRKTSRFDPIRPAQLRGSDDRRHDGICCNHTHGNVDRIVPLSRRGDSRKPGTLGAGAQRLGRCWHGLRDAGTGISVGGQAGRIGRHFSPQEILWQNCGPGKRHLRRHGLLGGACSRGGRSFFGGKAGGSGSRAWTPICARRISFR